MTPDHAKLRSVHRLKWMLSNGFWVFKNINQVLFSLLLLSAVFLPYTFAIRKNFWYRVLLVCGLIYIGQGSPRRWNTWSMPYLELEYMSLWSARHPGDPTLLLTPVIHCPRKDLRSWSQNMAYDIFHTHRSVQKAFSPAPVWLQRLSAFSSLSSTLQN